MLSIFSAILLPIVLIAVFGYLLARWGRLDPRPIARTTFYLFSPCLVFVALATSTTAPDLLGKLALLKLLVYVAVVPVAGWLAGRLSLSAPANSAFVLAAAFANSGNYGLSVNEYAFGSAGLALAVVCYVTDNLVLNSLGVYLAARGHASVRQALGQVIRNPALYAVILGVAVNRGGWTVPALLLRPLEMLGRAAVPTMLVVLGMQLALLRPERPRRGMGHQRWGVIGLATVLRLIVSPLLAFALTIPLGVTGLARQVGVLQAAVPSAVMGSVVASRYETEPDLVAGCILVSSLASLVTITALLKWLS
jgi:predicted permease